jgi:hypothetical protein
MVNKVSNYSNRDIERLYDRYNPSHIATGEMVLVSLHQMQYAARVIGLDLDIKNKKVYANLKLVNQNKRHPIRVDVADCTRTAKPLYPGHHNNS